MLSDLGQLGLASVGVFAIVCLLSGSLLPMLWAAVLWGSCVYAANYVDSNAS
jgi:hypothetical protein